MMQGSTLDKLSPLTSLAMSAKVSGTSKRLFIFREEINGVLKPDH